MIKATFAASLLMASLPASAAMLSGTTVNFYYDENDPSMALFGDLHVVNDSIYASPNGLRAESNNGGSNLLNIIGSVQVVAKQGYSLSGIRFVQDGDYEIFGAGASVNVTGSLTVESLNSNPVSATNTLQLAGDLNQSNLTTTWTTFTSMDLTTPQWNGVNSIELSLDSILTATTTNNGDSAWIQSKFVGSLVEIETTVIPVPAAAWLFGTGLLTLLGLARKRSNRSI